MKGQPTGHASPRSSRPASSTASIRKPGSPTFSPSSSISGPPHASTSSCRGVGPALDDAPHKQSASHHRRGGNAPLTNDSDLPVVNRSDVGFAAVVSSAYASG